jgi:hypothetical protein
VALAVVGIGLALGLGLILTKNKKPLIEIDQPQQVAHDPDESLRQKIDALPQEG